MTETTATEPSTGDHPFQAEVARLLHLMVHSVYSNKDIFLRELISNSADACEKLRYLAVQDAGLFGDDPDLRIRLSADAEAKTLTIADNGIGMDKTELVTNLGTIAHSGTRAFLDSLDEATDGSALIGQFGIGFYSAFMVASAVDVYSTKAGTDETWHWRSDGAGTFSVTIETDNPVSRGTKWSCICATIAAIMPRTRRSNASCAIIPPMCRYRSNSSSPTPMPGANWPTAMPCGPGRNPTSPKKNTRNSTAMLAANSMIRP